MQALMVTIKIKAGYHHAFMEATRHALTERVPAKSCNNNEVLEVL
jgi:hypothetical protein